MTQTTTTTPNPPAQPPAISSGDILINLIVTFLAPMFLQAAGGDINYARMAAAETLESYRAQTHADLITVAQLVAFGLAALGSLGLSMTDNISIPLTLRLRGNANACHRSGEQSRRALKQSQDAAPAAEPAPAPAPEPDPDQEAYEAAALASVAAAQKRVAETQARLQPDPSAKGPATDQQWQAMWATAAADVAAEYAAELKNLPPAQRRSAAIRAAALSTSATQLLSGEVPPRPRPGDLGAIMRP